MGGKKDKKESKRKQKTYGETLSAVTADMTDSQLREMALKQHINPSSSNPEAHKWNIQYGTLLKQRNSLRKKTTTKPTTKNTPEKVVAPATLQELRDYDFRYSGNVDETNIQGRDMSGERQAVVSEAVKSGEMRDLSTAVEQKYGKPYHEIIDPVDKQMAGDAVVDSEGNILPMSSASGQYSGFKRKAPKGFKMPGWGKRNKI